jgi:hypothetical protein
MDALIQASQAMATRLYQQAGTAAAGGEDHTVPEDEDVVEAEIIEDDEDA